MKIGVITNLLHIDSFVKSKLATASAAQWMAATGGNTGNVAFVQGVLNILGSEAGIVHWGDDPVAVNAHYDRLVICCANQLGSHIDLGDWANRVQAFDLPVTVFGLGAQANKIGDNPDVPEGSVEFLKAVAEHRFDPGSSNIVSRGDFSTSVIASFDVGSEPFGCPSQFISAAPSLGQQCLKHQSSSRHKRIMTAAGNPWHSSAGLEKTLIDLVNNCSGDYVLQHPESLLQLATGEHQALSDAQIKRFEEIYSFLGDFEDIASWFRAYCVYFADAQSWMNYAKRFSLVIGPRYHGVAIPIQIGVPGKVIAIDSRTEELSATTGVPFLHYEDVLGLDQNELLAQAHWQAEDADNYDAIRLRNAGHYLGFLEANGLPIADDFLRLSKT